MAGRVYSIILAFVILLIQASDTGGHATPPSLPAAAEPCPPVRTLPQSAYTANLAGYFVHAQNPILKIGSWKDVSDGQFSICVQQDPVQLDWMQAPSPSPTRR